MSRLRRTASAPASGVASGAGGWTLAAMALAALVGLPIAAIAWAALTGAGSGAALGALAETVLPTYIANTALLMLCAGTIAAVTGTGCA
ncbi:MAG TPA: iron ABC transporter permease, partial [Erythrobacter sp.]